MKRKNLNNIKKYEAEIIENYSIYVMKAFTFSVDQNKLRPPVIIDKINRIRKKAISQQTFDSIVYPELFQHSTQKMAQNLDPNVSNFKSNPQNIDIDIDKIINELESQNEDQSQKSTQIFKPSVEPSFFSGNKEEIVDVSTLKSIDMPNKTPKNSENITDNSCLKDETNYLTSYQLKALNELRQYAERISNEIVQLIQSNKPGTNADQLRQERRDIWEKIETIEKGIQAANDFYKMSNQNLPFVTDENEQLKKSKETVNSNERKESKNEGFLCCFNNSSSDDSRDNSDYDLSDLSPEQNESVVFDEKSSSFYDVYPEEKEKIDPVIFEKINRINHEIFHHAKFRGCQAAAIDATLNKDDVFLLMPTGGGKSLVYQIAGFVDQKLTVIVSPLISLIKDQISALRELNLSARSMTGETSKTEYKEIIEMIKNNALLFLYITPEKLLSSTNIQDFFYDINQNGQIARFVIDEAHCVSQWGHDFRPAYTELDVIKSRYENVPILAMTATATSAVKKDIINILKMPNCKIFQMSFNRPNLIYQVLDKGDTYQSFRTILSFINEHHFENKCGIIFCMTIADTESISSFLNGQGLKSRYYHAQMKDKTERHAVQQQWMDGKINIIVATLAFGMGIDKPDVRFVIHHTMPKSIESYYQESGRAGRDGLRSYCLLLFNYADRQRVERLIRCDYITFDTNPSQDQSIEKKKKDSRLGIELQLLDAMTNYCLDRTTCRRVMLLNYFSENFNPDDCNPKCDNCIRKENGNISIIKVDLTKHAEEMADIINEITKKRPDQPPYPTARYIISLYTGTESTRASVSGDSKMKQFGIGADMSLKDYLLHQTFPILIEKKILKTRIKLVKHGTIQYFATGQFYDDFKRDGFPNIEIEDEVAVRFEGMSKDDSELFPILLEKRRMLAEDKCINPNSICSMKVLKSMTKERPKVIDDLLKIPTMTNKKAKEYGKYFLEVISRFEAEIQKNSDFIPKSDSLEINADTINRISYQSSQPSLLKTNSSEIDQFEGTGIIGSIVEDSDDDVVVLNKADDKLDQNPSYIKLNSFFPKNTNQSFHGPFNSKNNQRKNEDDSVQQKNGREKSAFKNRSLMKSSSANKPYLFSRQPVTATNKQPQSNQSSFQQGKKIGFKRESYFDRNKQQNQKNQQQNAAKSSSNGNSKSEATSDFINRLKKSYKET